METTPFNLRRPMCSDWNVISIDIQQNDGADIRHISLEKTRSNAVH